MAGGMLKEKAREERLKEQMEAEIRDKDQQLLELMSSQTQVCSSRVCNIMLSELCHAIYRQILGQKKYS